MPDSGSSPLATPTPLLTAFAQRVAARDLPPVPTPHGYDAASLTACIVAALPAHFHYLDPRRAETFGRVCFALTQHPRLSTNELAAATAVSRLTLHRALPALVATGLLAGERKGGRHFHFLTRAGEDWLLEVMK